LALDLPYPRCKGEAVQSGKFKKLLPGVCVGAFGLAWLLSAPLAAAEKPIDNPNTNAKGYVVAEGRKVSLYLQFTEQVNTVTPGDEGDRGKPAQYCWGGSQSKSSRFEDTPVQVPVLDAKGKPTKNADGSPITRTEIVKRFEIITYECRGAALRIVTRCIFDKVTPGGCPPPRPHKKPNLRSLVNTLLKDHAIDLPLPRPVFAPQVKKTAPLVGLPFFYGVSAEQFNTPVSDDLRICFNEEDDCASIRLSAVPERVIFDPGESLTNNALRTTCKQPTPAIASSASAGRAGKDCMVTFQKAGSFPVEFILVYRLTWTLNEWSFVVGPPSTTESLPAAVPVPYIMVVKQRQPVVIG
jgi:hypothetical protein